jgi:hypothetical protein
LTHSQIIFVLPGMAKTVTGYALLLRAYPLGDDARSSPRRYAGRARQALARRHHRREHRRHPGRQLLHPGRAEPDDPGCVTVAADVAMVLAGLLGWLATGWVSRRTEHAGPPARSLTPVPAIIATPSSGRPWPPGTRDDDRLTGLQEYVIDEHDSLEQILNHFQTKVVLGGAEARYTQGG